jgi:uncharacterized protein YbaR (Trm112 family)
MQALEQIGEVLETIVCPVCHGRLELHLVTPAPRAKDTSPPREAYIRCVACRKSYPIEDGIPVLLVERVISEL